MSCQPDKYLKYTLRNKNKFEDVLTSLKQYFGLPFSLKFGDCIDNSFLSDFPTCKCYQCCFLLIFIPMKCSTMGIYPSLYFKYVINYA